MSFPSEPKVGPWGALLRVMTEPTRTFEALAERPAIFPAYFVQMLTAVIGTVLMMRLSLSAMADAMAKTPNAPPQAMQVAKFTTMVLGPIFAAGGPWLAGAILALIATFFAQFQGGSVGFRAYFSMIGYARIPLAIGTLLQTALMSTAPNLQQAQSMSISLAALAPQDSSVVLKAFLSTLNPFGLFYYALLAIGFAVLQRTRPAKSAAFVGTLYVIIFAFTALGLAYSKSRGM